MANQEPRKPWGLFVGAFVFGVISLGTAVYGLLHGVWAGVGRRNMEGPIALLALGLFGSMALLAAFKVIAGPPLPVDNTPKEKGHSGTIFAVCALLVWVGVIAFVFWQASRGE